MLLKDIGEKRLIREVIQKDIVNQKGLLPLNDDAQIIVPPHSFSYPMVVATDRTPTNLRPLMWGIYDYEQYGQYHAISNLSDIAAMGSKSFGYLLNIAAPPDLNLDSFTSIFNGVSKVLNKYETALLGGDTKEGTELNLVGVALGQSWKQSVLTRSGCKVGDKLIISKGSFGNIPAAHAYFSKVGWKQKNFHEKKLTEEFFMFEPRFAEAKLLQDSGVCTSCIDNSDGIMASMDELMEASGVGFILDVDGIEISDQINYVASELKRNSFEILLGAGGDFRLIATVSKFIPDFVDYFSIIGEVCEYKKTVSGSIDYSKVSRWNHFNI